MVKDSRGSRDFQSALPESRLCAFLLHWHGVGRQRAGMAALRRTVAQIQDVPLPFSDLESAILPARLADYDGPRLDRLIGEGEVVWQGHQALGGHDGQIVLYCKDDFPRLGRISMFAPGNREQRVRDALVAGDLDFETLSAQLGGFSDDLLKTLWKLVWNGEATTDSLDALRARAVSTAARYHPRPRPRYTTRRRMPPGAVGRWSLLSGPRAGFASEPERAEARVAQWLDRYGIVCSEILAAESAGMASAVPHLQSLAARGEAIPGDVLQTGSEQFLAPGAESAWHAAGRKALAGMVAACDPANPWGLIVPWPPMTAGYKPQRMAGARVFFAQGALLGYLTRTGRGLYTPRDTENPELLLSSLKRSAGGNPVFLEHVDGDPPYRTPWHGALLEAGFSPSRRGYLLRAGR